MGSREGTGARGCRTGRALRRRRHRDLRHLILCRSSVLVRITTHGTSNLRQPLITKGLPSSLMRDACAWKTVPSMTGFYAITRAALYIERRRTGVVHGLTYEGTGVPTERRRRALRERRHPRS
jgi:hypothetical protein